MIRCNMLELLFMVCLLLIATKTATPVADTDQEGGNQQMGHDGWSIALIFALVIMNAVVVIRLCFGSIADAIQQDIDDLRE